MDHLDKYLPTELTNIVYKHAFDDVIRDIPNHRLAGLNKWNNPSRRLVYSTVAMYRMNLESQDTINTPVYNVFAVI